MQTFISKLINTRTILFLAILLSVVAWVISFRMNFVLTYNDGASHLNIARRIVDNYTPGFAQIGTVWLPLPHLLMLPLAWQDFMWHSALAGSLVSMASYILCVVFSYKLAAELTGKKVAGVIAALVIGLNPNLLYLQTTPMTESLLLATFVMSAYYLYKFAATNNLKYLIITSLFVMASTLIRYDGWFLFVALGGVIPIWMLINHGWKKAEGAFFIYVVAGGLGIILWILWNWTIFGEPLYFLFGPYSAYAQQRVLSSVGQLPTEKNLYNALFYYLWATVENNGMVLVISSLVSLLIVPFLIDSKKYLPVYLALLTPFVFNVIALFVGQSAMNVMQAPLNPGLFNIRYGIVMLPGIAFILAIVGSKIRYVWLLVVLLIVAQTVLFVKAGQPITLIDGLNGLKNTYYTVEASKWLAENYSGGLILTSLASHDAFVARAQISMKNYIHEGNLGYWEEALGTPTKRIEYVALLVQPPDSVYRRLKDNPDFTKNFEEVHAYNEFKIFRRKH